jgi:DNA-binding CsgD family transcriptional regulator
MDNPKFKTVIDFVQAQRPETRFSFDGTRGSAKSRLCIVERERQMNCIDVALEGKSNIEVAQESALHALISTFLLTAKELYALMQVSRK